MKTIEFDDAVGMRIHLNELRSAFDAAMRQEVITANIKHLYKQIKELESCLAVIEWDAPTYQLTDLSAV